MITVLLIIIRHHLLLFVSTTSIFLYLVLSMSLLFIAPNRNMKRWEKAVLEEDPDLDVEIWPDVADPKRVQFAVTWRQPEHVLNQYPNLKAISSIGAGVNHILEDDTVPNDLPICRVVSPSLNRQMQEYVLSAVLNYQRNTFTYFKQKQQGVWKEHRNKSPDEIHSGVMGLGALGRPIAEELARFNYKASGWSKSRKEIEDVDTFAGQDEFEDFLTQTNVLICVLPLTEETRDILDLDVFKKMQHPGFLINVARGEHLVEEDLIYALDKGWMEGACLDVFSEEPLSENHPFWNRENIMITPHVSSVTEPDEVAGQLVENYKRLMSGMELKHTVDRQKGY